MLTFQQIYEAAQDEVKDYDTVKTLPLLKRAINQGMQKFGAILNREWRIKEVTFSTVASQQYYQLPEDCIRPQTIIITIGGIDYPLIEVADETAWNDINRYRDTETSDFPTHYHIKGADLFGIYPVPASSTSNGGLLTYEPRMRRMTAADYVTGSIAVTSASAAIVGTGTTFTAQMVGRVLLVENDSDQDGVGYKVDSFTDATHINVENLFGGLTASGVTYRIGVVPDIPDEFHESLVDYASYRYYKRRRDRRLSADAKEAFDEAIQLCRDEYSSMSTSQYGRVYKGRSSLFAYDRSLDRTVST